MEPVDDLGADPQLSALLKEWQISDAPLLLDSRILCPRKTWWRFLLTGWIRIPVPVAVLAGAILLIMAAVLVRQRTLAPEALSSINLADFTPVKDFNVRVTRGHQDGSNDER
jgi:hypothetical protein